MEKWVTITEAAKEVGVSHSKLSRLVREGKLASEKSVFDMRVTLVDIEQVRAMFPANRRFNR